MLLLEPILLEPLLRVAQGPLLGLFLGAQAAVAARLDLVASQETAALTYTSPWQRVQAVIAQPFLTPPQFYESDTWQ